MANTAGKKKNLGVVAQVRTAFSTKNRLAAFVGSLLGGFVPLATYTVAHHGGGLEVKSIAFILVIGGLLYSATTVFQWARLAFSSPTKSVGFCLLLEGVMVCGSVEWLALTALAYLIGINAIATGCTLALQGGSSRSSSSSSARKRKAAPSGKARLKAV